MIRESKHSYVAIALLAVVISSLFTFIIYPRIDVSLDTTLDTDGYGRLGYGIWKNGSLSYFPNTNPTIHRGPLYPLFIASLLWASGGWYPYSIQVSQCLIFGIICLLVFWISLRLFSRKTAFFAMLVCSFNPMLIWYTPRIWAEILLCFLFTLLIATLVRFSEKPSGSNAVLIGMILGGLVLGKQTFLPFILFIPLLIRIILGMRKYILLLNMILTALVIIAPWSVRNWCLTGMFIPVHSNAGLQLQVGDLHLEKLRLSPFINYEPGSDLENQTIAMMPKIQQDIVPARKKAIGDAVLLRDGIINYIHNPFLLVKKVAMNAYMFWFSGSTKMKTAAIMLIQLPVVLMFLLFSIRVATETEKGFINRLIVIMIWIYFGLHLPFLAIARYSIVLIPVISIYAVEQFQSFRRLRS